MIEEELPDLQLQKFHQKIQSLKPGQPLAGIETLATYLPFTSLAGYLYRRYYLTGVQLVGADLAGYLQLFPGEKQVFTSCFRRRITYLYLEEQTTRPTYPLSFPIRKNPAIWPSLEDLEQEEEDEDQFIELVLTQFHLTFPHLFWRNLSNWLKGVREGGSQLASCFYNPSFNPTEIRTFLTYHKNNIGHYRPVTQLRDLQSLKESGF